ncbi:cobalt transporter ATP-binding protein [Fructilactobacillus fructivorans]|uniref:energy-coupling factor transporter ATPase n=1 Tax=Fructilactobacillus fructivorans TaxID=1614 RepID=UPI000704F93D|nr:energy-coupling factor transporter ATPase [Fructilactobacillus fructivorans]KRN12202.1 cobalt transporter ATP-binding protein [Fructilactobacillus fructivorans]
MDPIIRVSNLSFQYDDEDASKILDDISFQCEKGEYVSLIGKNGSGKSTIAKLIDGLLAPQTGTIKINDIGLSSHENDREMRKSIGLVFQNPDDQFVGATVASDVAFGLENRAVPREIMKSKVKVALKRVGMWDFRNEMPSSLSGGQKQRVAIAGAIVLDPQILILDEATSMLDPLATKQIYEVVNKLNQKQNMTILSITHDINVTAKSDRILALNDSKIIFDGKPSVFFQKHELIANMDLELPFSEKLRQKFIDTGYDISDRYMDDEEISQWISKLF